MNKGKRYFLFVSIFSNRSILLFFKDSGFLAENLHILFRSIGMETSLASGLPDFGISFPAVSASIPFNK